MLSGALVRFSKPTVSSLGRPALLSATQSQPGFARRRLSSSKASSIPPDDDSKTNAPARKVTGKTPKKRASPPAVTVPSASKKKSAPPALNVPYVPSTNYLADYEVTLASLFSQHRPMSITNQIPTIARDTTSFNSIFKDRTAKNIMTMANGLEKLEAALRVQERQAPEDTLESQGEVQHLDGYLPRISLDKMASRFTPFQPPPVPVPFGEFAESESLAQADPVVEDVLATVSPAKQRAWSTEVVVTESTDAQGQRTWSATTGSMIEISVPSNRKSQKMEAIEMRQPYVEMEAVKIRQPFLERMKQRQDIHTRYLDKRVNPDMLAISVKRQRRLKMKKHKYKKLMKRTRLLRRKLDRL